MAEPLTRSDLGGEGAATSGGTLADAGLRLQRALASLEAAIGDGAGDRPAVGPPDAPPPAYLAIELETSRWRERELQAAAAAASKALERAMAEVSRALQVEATGAEQGSLDLPLESEAGSHEDPTLTSPEEDPTE